MRSVLGLILLAACTARRPTPEPKEDGWGPRGHYTSAKHEVQPVEEPAPTPPSAPAVRPAAESAPPKTSVATETKSYCERTKERRIAAARAREERDRKASELAEYRKKHCQRDDRAVRTQTNELCIDENGVLRRCNGIVGVEYVYHCPSDGPPGARGTVAGGQNLAAMEGRAAATTDEMICGRIDLTTLADAGAP